MAAPEQIYIYIDDHAAGRHTNWVLGCPTCFYTLVEKAKSNGTN